MQVSVEATSGLERRMKVTIPADDIDKEVEKRLKSLSRTVKMKGFRPGKVPLRVIANQYGPAVRQEVLSELTQNSFREAVAQENLQLASMPRIEPQSAEQGENFEYTAVFEVVERFDVAPVKDIKIKRPVAEINEQDVDNMLENLRRQRAQWQDVERPAQEGDRLIIDYRGTINDEPFEGNEGQQVPLVLGEGKFIAGFEEQLNGAKAGDDTMVETTFPDDYHAKDLAGQAARFEIHVHSVAESVLPEIDEEFVRSYDVPSGSLDELRGEVRKSMEDELEQTIREKIKQQVMDGLLEANPIQLPQAQVEEQIEVLMNQMRENLQRQGINFGDVELQREMFEEQARKRVALGMLTAEIVKQQNLVAEPEGVRTKVESLAAAYDSPDEVIRWYYADRSRLSSIESLVLEDQVVDWVLLNAQVTDESTTFEDLMKEARG